ncbi:hypothetical protein BDFB_012964, partial [Asbolus verrucosus]
MANFPRLYEHLLQVDWSFLYTYSNVNMACEITSKVSSTYPPWFTLKIITLLKQKEILHKRYKFSGYQLSYNEFKNLRVLIKSLISSSFRAYILKIENEIKVDPKKFWSFIKSKLYLNGVSYNKPQDILNAFAHFFSSIHVLSSPVNTIDG